LHDACAVVAVRTAEAAEHQLEVVLTLVAQLLAPVLPSAKQPQPTHK